MKILRIVASSGVGLLILAGCTGFSPPSAREVGVVAVTAMHERAVAGFKEEMARLGYREGTNIRYLRQSATRDMAKLSEYLEDFRRRRVSLVLALSIPAAAQAKKILQGSGIPIIAAPVFHPVEAGLVDSVARPGGDMTGVQCGGSGAKAVEWLVKIVPRARRIFVPVAKGDVSAAQSLEEVKRGARALGLDLVVQEVTDEQSLDQCLSSMPSTIDAIWLLNSPLLVSNADHFAEAGQRRRRPVGSAAAQRVPGILVTYGQDLFRTGQQAARLADKVLRGASAGGLPVETADYFLKIDLRAAAAIGLDVPDHVLRQADFIVR